MKSVADAVHYAHRKGIIHRDIKPHNVLIDLRDSPRVTDFGLAKQISSDDSELTLTGQIVGTPSFMAPEQAACTVDEVGPLSDVYSLGATLYFLLTGIPPFQSANAIETIRQVIDGEPVPLRRITPSIPRDLETVCMKCLERAPHRRYATVNKLSLDLSRYLASKPVFARPVSRLQRLLKWCCRNRLAAMTIAVCALLLFGWAASATVGYYRAIRRDQHSNDALESLDEAFNIIRSENEDMKGEFDRLLQESEIAIQEKQEAEEEKRATLYEMKLKETDQHQNAGELRERLDSVEQALKEARGLIREKETSLMEALEEARRKDTRLKRALEEVKIHVMEKKRATAAEEDIVKKLDQLKEREAALIDRIRDLENGQERRLGNESAGGRKIPNQERRPEDR